MGENGPDPDDLGDLKRFVVAGTAGDVVFREGDADTDLYLVLQGHVELSLPIQGRATPIARLGPGEFFGEEGLLEGGARTATAEALTKYKLLKVSPSSFVGVIREKPEIAIRMLVSLSTRLHERKRSAVADRGAERAATEDPASVSYAMSYSCLVHQASGREIPVPPDRASSVGRPDREKNWVPDLDLSELDSDRTVSRRHAMIVPGNDGFHLVDQIGAPNGTYVNGKRLESGIPVSIQDGDEIRFGLVALTFCSR